MVKLRKVDNRIEKEDCIFTTDFNPVSQDFIITLRDKHSGLHWMVRAERILTEEELLELLKDKLLILMQTLRDIYEI